MAPTIGELIASTDRCDPAAADALFEALYAELHRMARHQLAAHGWEGRPDRRG